MIYICILDINRGRMYEIPSEDPYWNGVYGKYTLECKG